MMDVILYLRLIGVVSLLEISDSNNFTIIIQCSDSVKLLLSFESPKKMDLEFLWKTWNVD